ncbi:MAG: hypothetical protein L6V86_09250 [Treponema sp.]|nr:MAG: hypothetical protein L6V86_09250 [Treponema sp.]
MKYVNDLIDCGADGFRYDTAKHIGLPDDPKDPYAKENNFWPIFLGKEPVNGVFMKKNSDELYLWRSSSGRKFPGRRLRNAYACYGK